MRLRILASALFVLATSLFAHADTVVYSNTANNNLSQYSGYVLNGGATQIGSTLYTRLLADDITSASGTAGTGINAFEFSVANLNSTAVNVDVIFQIFAANSNGTGPGSILFSYTFANLGFSASTANLRSAAAGGVLFAAPSNFYAGLIFSDGGRGDLTVAQLNNLGQVFFGPPTVGSSANTYFASTNASNGSANPSGSLQTGSTGSFGFQFSNTLPSPVAATPEPSSLLLLGTGTLGVIGAARRRLFA